VLYLSSVLAVFRFRWFRFPEQYRRFSVQEPITKVDAGSSGSISIGVAVHCRVVYTELSDSSS
jgi:hypothetical protein